MHILLGGSAKKYHYQEIFEYIKKSVCTAITGQLIGPAGQKWRYKILNLHLFRLISARQEDKDIKQIRIKISRTKAHYHVEAIEGH
jgi:hypothetical protein